MASKLDAELAVSRGEASSESEFWLNQAKSDGADFTKLDERQAKLAREQEKLEQQRQEQLHAWEEFRHLLKRRDRAKSALSNAKANREKLQELYDGFPYRDQETAMCNPWGSPTAHKLIIEIGPAVAAQRELLEHFPKLIERKTEELESLEQQVVSFAKKHGFTDPATIPAQPGPESEDESDAEDQDADEGQDDGEDETEEFASEPVEGKH